MKVAVKKKHTDEEKIEALIEAIIELQEKDPSFQPKIDLKKFKK